MAKCAWCKGTGVCPECKGEGAIICPACGGKGVLHGLFGKHVCGDCNGDRVVKCRRGCLKGRCPACRGTGSA